MTSPYDTGNTFLRSSNNYGTWSSGDLSRTNSLFTNTWREASAGNLFGAAGWHPMGANQGYASPYDMPGGGQGGGTGYESGMDAYFASNPRLATATPAVGAVGAVNSLGGDWSGVDQWNAAIQTAAVATGIDPNMIKATMKLESDGNPNATGSKGVVGLMQINTNTWGSGPWVSDNAANIMKGAQILKQNYDENGGNWYEALRHYHGIGNDLDTSDRQYADIVMGNYNQLGSAGPGAGLSAGTPGVGDGSQTTNQVITIAKSYVGVPYTWGGIPGKGDNPWDSGWDCSGFMYWLDQNYGNGQLPMGSHYQYQDAQQKGLLFTDTAQLQPGDLVWFDTNFTEGGGAELNHASHVGMYIGNDQFIEAANPSTGTVVAQFSTFGGFLGARHMSWSGGAAGTAGATVPTAYNPNDPQNWLNPSHAGSGGNAAPNWMAGTRPPGMTSFYWL